MSGDPADRQLKDNIANCSQMLYSYFMGKTSYDPHLSMDLTQEAIYRGLRARKSYQQGSTLSTWMYVVGRSVAIDHFRRSRHHPETLEDFDPPDKPKPDFDTYREGIAMIHRLPRNFAPVILLLALGKKPREIAADLQLTDATVRGRIYHARNRLRDMGLVELLSTGQKPR